MYKSPWVTLKGYLREISGPIPPLQGTEIGSINFWPMGVGGEHSAPSASTPLTRPPLILPLRLHPLLFWRGEGGGQCGNVTLPHCSPTLQCGKETLSHCPPPPITKLIRNQQQTVTCIKEWSGT
jgi:hypothetical protein